MSIFIVMVLSGEDPKSLSGQIVTHERYFRVDSLKKYILLSEHMLLSDISLPLLNIREYEEYLFLTSLGWDSDTALQVFT